MRYGKQLFKKTNIFSGLLICAALLSALAFSGGCQKKSTPQTPPAPKPAGYIVMEKVLSDQPARPRTTLKVIIPEKEDTTAALKAALTDVRKDDAALKAVIIWAYRSRGELNGSNFTAGKLEWAADGKDFNGTNSLSPNPKIDALDAAGR